MRKKRILFVGEASFLATGFSTYWNETLKRIHATGKFEIAELGSYTNPTDHRCSQVPWKFYPVAPDPGNKEAAGKYNAGMPTAQFGEWCFDDVCLEFKPDIVCGIRDWWMDEFILRSPFRKNFKFMWMPTIDGAPQRELWLDGYNMCDGVLTYSKWGMDLLKKTGRKDTPLIAVASPGADIETFAPIQNKAQHKRAVGLPPDANVIGTVMRNQKRKLYVNLIEDFSIWLKKAKTKSKAGAAQKTFLYLHTSYPDVGYDIGKAIREFKVGKHVLMTYLCRNCNTAYPSLFKGEIAICRNCGQYKAQPPNATHHCPRNVLASIMNLFDLYVQYSICLHPETKVMLPNRTHVEIQDIKPGDEIVSCDGSIQKVKNCWKTSDESETIKIKTYGNTEEVICTPEHRFMVIDPVTGNTDFCEAKELLNKWVAYPIDRTTNNKIYDKEFLYTLGAYIGDGATNSPGSFSIAYNTSQGNRAKRVENYLDSIEITNSRTYHKKANEFRVIGSNTKYTKYLESLVGSGAKNKHIPQDMMQMDPELQKSLLQGLFDSDGCIIQRKSIKQREFCYSTISRQLAYQVRDLFLRQNIACGIQIQYREGRQPKYDIRSNDQQMFEILGQARPPDIPIGRRDTFLKIVNNYLCMRVRSITIDEYNGPVYDLEVQVEKGGSQKLHSFVVHHFVSHNCEG